MYYPYFRGKQYELVTVREAAPLLAASGFVPIIEPVKESVSGLLRAVDAIQDSLGEAVLIVNPGYGDHANDPEAIAALFAEGLQGHRTIAAGIALTADVTLDRIVALTDVYQDRPITFVHAGFADAKGLSDYLSQLDKKFRHVFFGSCGKLYQRHFKGSHRVLLRDGFKRRINREHPSVEFFSDLHVTYEDEGMDGFGDFLIVGDEYLEAGGPAYAVAIHLTFVDPMRDDGMYVFHFVSNTQDTPTDPAGKFAESLEKLVAEVNRPGTHLMRTEAVGEFLELHEKGHYPGLGYVKKLSMKHHIETLSAYFNGQ